MRDEKEERKKQIRSNKQTKLYEELSLSSLSLSPPHPPSD